MTAIIQSSSVTTVMLVGFVTANLMSLSQAIGVILGADIGTTITAQIVAFPIKKYALLLVAAGFLMTFTSRKEDVRQYGVLVMGLGLIFFGMAVMSGAMKPLRSYQPFIDLMQNVSNPLVGILVSTAFTALVQSSSATMGIVIVLASQGLISLEGGIALALGANIGTCATAGLAALGKPREAVRVAVAHVTFKIVGVLLIVWFIPPFADLVRSISPASEHLTGMDRLAADTPRQVANAHTLFNVGIAFLFLPFAGVFARFCEWVVPDRPLTEAEELDARHEPKYLDDVLLDTPALALERAQLEIGRLGDRVSDMYEAFLEPTFAHDTDPTRGNRRDGCRRRHAARPDRRVPGADQLGRAVTQGDRRADPADAGSEPDRAHGRSHRDQPGRSRAEAGRGSASPSARRPRTSSATTTERSAMRCASPPKRSARTTRSSPAGCGD